MPSKKTEIVSSLHCLQSWMEEERGRDRIAWKKPRQIPSRVFPEGRRACQLGAGRLPAEILPAEFARPLMAGALLPSGKIETKVATLFFGWTRKGRNPKFFGKQKKLPFSLSSPVFIRT